MRAPEAWSSARCAIGRDRRGLRLSGRRGSPTRRCRTSRIARRPTTSGERGELDPREHDDRGTANALTRSHAPSLESGAPLASLLCGVPSFSPDQPAADPTPGNGTRVGGRTASRTAPTRSTKSRSSRSRPSASRARPRVVDVGTGEGQIARLATRLGARRSSSGSTRPARSSRSRPSAAAGRYTSGAAPSTCRSPTRASTPRSRAWCSSTFPTTAADRRDRTLCSSRAGGSCSCSTIRSSRRPTAAG